MSERVDVSNLFVVDYNSMFETDEMRNWRENTAVPFAASCSRQIWYGHEKNFKDFPYPENRAHIKTVRGVEGYAALLRVVSGFESQRLGETHIRSQFYDGWRCIVEKNPIEAINYEKIVGQINEDVSFVRNNIASQFKTRRHELAARDISGQSKGDKVLLIGEVGKGDNLSAFTLGLVRVSENKQKRQDNFMTITHPDDAKLESIKNMFGWCKHEKELRSNIEFIPFSDLSAAIEENNMIYIDIPMELYKEADIQIIQAWSGRINRQNTLTHMRGDPTNKALSSDDWKNAGLDNYFSPEDIRAEMSERGRKNKLVISKSKQAFDMCAELRLAGHKPANKIIDNDGEELSYEV